MNQLQLHQYRFGLKFKIKWTRLIQWNGPNGHNESNGLNLDPKQWFIKQTLYSTVSPLYMLSTGWTTPHLLFIRSASQGPAPRRPLVQYGLVQQKHTENHNRGMGIQSTTNRTMLKVLKCRWFKFTFNFFFKDVCPHLPSTKKINHSFFSSVLHSIILTKALSTKNTGSHKIINMNIMPPFFRSQTKLFP